MVLVVFILPLFSVDNYSIIKNTTSQLGAQSAPNSWIMNSTFVILGVASIIDGWRFFKDFWFHRIVLGIFGLSLIFAAIFQHSPIDSTAFFDIEEDKLHSLFSMITGTSFTLLSFSAASILRLTPDKIIAIAVGTLATLLSVLMFKLDDFSGIWQRIIFLSSFGWMIYIFRFKDKLIDIKNA